MHQQSNLEAVVRLSSQAREHVDEVHLAPPLGAHDHAQEQLRLRFGRDVCVGFGEGEHSHELVDRARLVEVGPEVPEEFPERRSLGERRVVERKVLVAVSEVEVGGGVLHPAESSQLPGEPRLGEELQVRLVE